MRSLKVSSLALLSLFALGACGTQDAGEPPVRLTIHFDEDELESVDCIDFEILDDGLWSCETDLGEWQYHPERTIDHLEYHD